MTRIERRQNRIRRIREQHSKAKDFADDEGAGPPEVHHVIGKSQNLPEAIPLFLQKHAGDPAVKVCVYTRFSIPNHAHLSLGFYSKTQSPPIASNQNAFVSGS